MAAEFLSQTNPRAIIDARSWCLLESCLANNITAITTKTTSKKPWRWQEEAVLIWTGTISSKQEESTATDSSRPLVSAWVPWVKCHLPGCHDGMRKQTLLLSTTQKPQGSITAAPELCWSVGPFPRTTEKAPGVRYSSLPHCRSTLENRNFCWFCFLPQIWGNT